MIFQRTLKSKISVAGIGLHTGDRVRLTLRPAPINMGIVFVRADLSGAPTVKAEALAVNDTRMSTCITNAAGVRVATIEHLMSAFYGLGIDNAYVDLTASEVPIMDGSAATFVFMMREAGIVEQAAPKRYIRIKKPIAVTSADGHKAPKTAKLEPHWGFTIDYRIQFDHPVFENEPCHALIDFAQMPFITEVARARTFGFVAELEAMRKVGLGRGASLDNAIVVDDFRVLNSDGLRVEDEFTKHKALDAVGDLYLSGAPLIGAYTTFKGGHALNNQLVRAMLADESSYEVVTFAHSREVPQAFSRHLVTDAVPV
jgi:UDP-3-O-[3-hydroxymyristoyl] N-acetylglucosamine deacetylase